MATTFQFLVEFVEYQITQQWGKGTALRRALIGRKDQPVFHDPGAEKRPDQFEHSFVGDTLGNAGHQPVMVDSIKELFQINVDHIVVALSNVTLRLGYGLMSRASRSESVAVLGKRRVPPLLENLQQRLLDQSVDDTRNAEFSDPAIRLGYFDPSDRLRLVSSLKQLRPDSWPMLTQVFHGGVDGHTIHTRTTFVPTDAFPRYFEVLSIAHLLH